MSEESLFLQAAEMPPDERAAFLAELRRGDPALAERVAGLLRANEEAPDFMEVPPADRPEPESSSIGFGPAEIARRVGRYKLLQKIGEGGCGVVYMADQEVPVRRRVALKIIKLGMDTKAVIARFEAERQALAMMDHPHIAKVLDAGATDAGRPFFVMELVRGIPITKYCDKNNLTIRQRLELFIETCDAIGHAHQKGVIHRDIKPSNILVTYHQGAPVPKVIDFGIAKAAQGRLTDQTLFTAFEQFIGTPAYVSPEQAEMSGLEIDTRSDIYSLGVLLYELLTARTPFDHKDLLEPGLDEMRRRICQQEPTRPSMRLGALPDGDRTTIARQRRADVQKLTLMLRGDLDWVVMRCLEKDRTRRYETAEALAADVQRHIRHEPVVARPPTLLYRLAKLIRRHRLAFLSIGAIVASLTAGLWVSRVPIGPAAAIVGSLLAGLIASIVLYWQEQHAEREKNAAVNRALQEKARAEQAQADEAKLRLQAEANEKKAQAAATRSAQVAQFLKDMLKDGDALIALGYDTKLLRGIVDLMAKRLKTDLGGHPDVEADLREIMGSVYLNLDLFETAAAMFSEALAIRRRLCGEEHLEVARSLNYLGVVLGRQGRLPEAEETIRLGIAIQEKLLGPGSPAVAESQGNLGVVLAEAGRPAEARAAVENALVVQEKLFGREHADVARSLKKLGAILQQDGKLAEAMGCLREALAINRKLLGNQHPEVASSLQLLAVALIGLGHNREAEASYREAVAIRHQVPTTAARSAESLIAALEQQGSLAELDRMLMRTVDFMRARFGARSWEAAFAAAPRVHVMLLEGKFAEAEAPARECLSIREGLNPGNWSTFHMRSMLGAALSGQGRFAEAEPLLINGYEGLVRCEAEGTLPPENETRIPEAADRLVRLYGKWEQAEKAETWMRVAEAARASAQQAVSQTTPREGAPPAGSEAGDAAKVPAIRSILFTPFSSH